MLLRRGTWLQSGESADRGNMELRVMLVDIFQPALVSGLQSACGTALHILCHKDRSLRFLQMCAKGSSELTELHVVCVGVSGLVGRMLPTLSPAMGTPGLPQFG